MILYLDTSALVKLYVAEPGRDLVLRAMTQAASVATNAIAYLELFSAVARLGREARLTDLEARRIKRDFTGDWREMAVVAASDALIRSAATYPSRFGLRAYDSLHLAAAHLLHKQGSEQVVFATFDRRLGHAAESLGMTVLSAEAAS